MSIFTEDEYTTLKAALREWEHNDWTQLIQTVTELHAIVAVYQKNGHKEYTILRAFLMGSEPMVSCDAYEVPPDEAMYQLCRIMGAPNSTTWEDSQI